MITKEQIENFYRHIDGIGLKFPVASISKATGFSKSNVSEYLSRGKPPSENFINAVYEKFPKGSVSVPHETPPPPPMNDKYIQMMEARIKDLEDDKAFFKRMVEANLVGLSDVAQTTLAYQKAWVDYMTEQDAEGNPKKAAQLRLHLNKLIASKMGVNEHTDISS